MIVTQPITIGQKNFIYTYSDSGFYIECDGNEYSDAIDLPQFNYIYKETNHPLPEQEIKERVKAMALDKSN